LRNKFKDLYNKSFSERNQIKYLNEGDKGNLFTTKIWVKKDFKTTINTAITAKFRSEDGLNAKK